jgi:porphobilinogen synthase
MPSVRPSNLGKSNKKVYQMDPGNTDEALREVRDGPGRRRGHGDGQAGHALPWTSCAA